MIEEPAMRKSLPSLTSLYAFEAAARHLSFRRAAIELNLTQSAISQRIIGLEDLLDTKLFIRENNTIRLTDPGHQYVRSVRNAIAEVMSATDRASERQRKDTLTIACLGTFSLKCLIPALKGFKAAYPKISLRVRTLFPYQHSVSDDFDVSIQYGTGDWPGMTSWKINDEEVFPVCSPALLRGRRALKKPSDLCFHTIIRTSSPLILRDDWPLWLEEAGVSDISFADEISCDLLYPSFQTAIEGLGVAMGRSAVVANDLRSKRLVEPFNIRLPSALAYYVVVPQHRNKLPKIDQFTNWILSEFANTDPAGN
jgi:LysR family glycine cleavage system transcriptional activator